jgi:hypothetical protein
VEVSIVTVLPFTVKVPEVSVRPKGVEARGVVAKLPAEALPIPDCPLTTLAVAVCLIWKLNSPLVALALAAAFQVEFGSAMVAAFFSSADSVPMAVTLDLSVETAERTSLSAVVLWASSVFSRRIRFCGARLTSMSWSTMPFQSKPETRPDNAIPAIIRESEEP